MEGTWILFEGNDGIDRIFDTKINPNKRHKRDDALVPFKTKVDKNQYVKFDGVVGEFSRLISSTAIKSGLDKNIIKAAMRKKMNDECTDEDFDKLFHIIDSMYFDNGKLLPINAKALNYIESNVSQRQVAEYLYSLFVEDTDLVSKYEKMSAAEDTNVLEKLVFDSLEDPDAAGTGSIQSADCFLPYVKEVFYKDFEALTQNAGDYQKYINRFLAYYYMFYVSQLAVKLSKFEYGQRDKIETIYMTLYDEVVTRVRPGYEYGWKYVKEKLGHMFSHSVVLEMLSHNIDDVHMDYIGVYDRFNKSDLDEVVAGEIEQINKSYRNWIQMDYSGCHHDESKSKGCLASDELRKLYETIDFQFINGGRKSHYNGYNKKFIDFVQKNFGKFRGMYGYTVSLHDNDIIMFTQIILKENDGRIRLAKLFEEFELRGLLFDRESKKRIIELYEKMNLLEKRSDSGDAQYVKYVL